jgi:phosphoribosyl 1,2-cyclic phosphate phosphodiesterase
MRLIFLGTGTSQGVPTIAHPPGSGPDLDDPRNWRTRSSVHVVIDGCHVQVDAAPELRLQCIHNRITQVDAFILTHAHADHILGMDDLRRFIDLRDGVALPVYSTADGLTRVREIYPYAIRPRPEFSGYPAFQPELLPLHPQVLRLPGGGTLRATLLPHGRMQVLGLLFEEAASGRRLAYYTDCKRLTPEALELARGVDVAVLDALRPHPHPTHMCIDEAVEAARALGASRSFFTHMTFHVDHAADSARLPAGMDFAHDGLVVEI